MLVVVIILLVFEIIDFVKGKGCWEMVKIIDFKDFEYKYIIEKKIYYECYVGED